MIILFTDFSYNGPYVGQLKSAIYQLSQNIKIIDLMHDAPKFDVKHSALLLSTLINKFPKNSVFCCVVDPGVGSKREALVLKVDEQYFIGPDNGLFEYILRSGKLLKTFKIIYKPETISKTFHGRDIFAPIAAQLEDNNFTNLEVISPNDLLRYDWKPNLEEIIYIDSFGNLMTGIKKGALSKVSIIHYKGHEINFSAAYSGVLEGDFCWYVNSNDLIEIAVNSGSAASVLDAQIGDFVKTL